jgi:hypothetical protein
MRIDENRVTFLMQKLRIPREEAIDMIKYDDDVNHERKTKHDLSREQKAIVQDMTRHCDHKKYGEGRHGHRQNDLKISIMNEIASFLRDDAQNQVYEDIELTNPTRMMHFRVDDKEFDLQLIEKRGPQARTLEKIH